MPRKSSLNIFVKQGEKLLTTVKEMRESLEDEPDPDRRRQTIRLLKVALEKIAVYRKGLEAFRHMPYVGKELEEQIQLLLLIEDECRVDKLLRRLN